MKLINFPRRLKYLLEDSRLQGPISAFAEQVGTILKNNELPFFPGYTDHGVEHIHQVLTTQVDLIPRDIWEPNTQKYGPRLLTDIDAVVMIGATLLHDIAMFLQPKGFFELIDKESKYKPLDWFDQDHYGHLADRPWHELWADYEREVRRFSDQQMEKILGEKMTMNPGYKLPRIGKPLNDHDKLIIGEFLRRHHARLAHEIAIYGFPGLTSDEFGVLATKTNPLTDYADLIGLVARSHWMSMRVCQQYLTESPKYTGAIRPMGAAVLYLMALLRVADYLQIDQTRAPAVLMQLKDPQSQVSVKEWRKHKTVRSIGPGRDPSSTSIIVDEKTDFELYLSIKQLLDGLQEEMDHSNSVLEENYGNRSDLGLHRLRLKTKRVQSNLYEMSFQKSLPYVPRPTGYSSDPRILSLLVEPLYGKYPNVGVRELIQNSVDAVRELKAWCDNHDEKMESLDLPKQDADVLIEFIKLDVDGKWILKVTDKGIGMTSNTIENYFLRAGASFRYSQEWSTEFLSDDGKSSIARAGKFGIGVFSIFLLGDRFEVNTRHVSGKDSEGVLFKAHRESNLIKIEKCNKTEIGTTIIVYLSEESVKSLELDSKEKSWNPNQRLDWYCWDWPVVNIRKYDRSLIAELPKDDLLPISNRDLPASWSRICLNDLNEVCWTLNRTDLVSCNGLRITNPEKTKTPKRKWFDNLNKSNTLYLEVPEVAVVDNSGLLPLTTQRYAVGDGPPFADELYKDVCLSFIAYALIDGPQSSKMATIVPSHPLLNTQSLKGLDDHSFGMLQKQYMKSNAWKNRWWFNSAGFCFSVNELFDLLNRKFIHSFAVVPRYKNPPSKDDLVIDLNGFLDADNALESVCVVDYSQHFSFEANFHVNWHGIRGNNFSVNDLPVIKRFNTYKSNSLSVMFDWLVVAFTKDLVKETDLSVSCLETNACYDLDNEEQKAVAAKLASAIQNEDTTVFSQPVDAVICAKTQPCGAKTQSSMLSNLWRKYLGHTLIPFDQSSRDALIQKACKHSQLRVHIEKWKKLRG